MCTAGICAITTLMALLLSLKAKAAASEQCHRYVQHSILTCVWDNSEIVTTIVDRWILSAFSSGRIETAETEKLEIKSH